MDPIRQAIIEAYQRLCAPGAPFELVTDDTGGAPLPAFRNAPRTLRELFAPAYAHGEREFVVYEDERWSFARLLALADAIAGALLRSEKVQPGERVAIAMRNYPEWLAAFVGIASIGAVVVPLNSWGSADELDYVLGDCGARLVFCDRQRCELIAPRLGSGSTRAIVARAGTAELPPNALALETFVAGSAGLAPAQIALDPGAPALILYTSGTTGRPKGAVSTHRAVCQAIFCFECSGAVAAMTNPEWVGAMTRSGFAPTALLAVPLFHVSGLYSVFLLALRAGRRIVMMYKWDVQRALELIERERVTQLTGAPSMILELLESPLFATRDTASLMAVGAGGAATPGRVAALMSQRLRNPFPGTGWGMTETNALGSSFAGKAFAHRPDAAGIVQPLVQLRFVDEDGAEQQACVPGRILVRSVALISGYWNRPEADAAALKDGWFDSGDIGFLDADGWLRVTDRAKDMLIRGGENIYPLEIESLLNDRPDVVEAAVFGVPDAQWGEEVALVLRTTPGAALSVEEVRSWLAARLAPYKLPRFVELRAEPLPRNATQKLLKRELRAEFLARHATSSP